MLNIISTLNIGFSLIIALILFICYSFFLKNHNKSALSVVTCGLFLAGISALQLQHLGFFLDNADPLGTLYYRVLLFLVPPMFYFFSRVVLFPDYRLKVSGLLHFLPLLLAVFLSRDIAVPIAFVIGTGYCLWLAHIIYRLKKHRKRFEIEFFFFAFFSVLAFAVLLFGFSASFIDSAYFYQFYANGLAFAYMLVTAALVIYPDLLNELTEVVKLSYRTSTLVSVDIKQRIEQLERLMCQSKLYQNDDLSLATLADTMDLSSHQLSELINTHYGVNFSRYIRELRVDEAKKLLKNEPNSSVLSISLETGFKSQSNFYAAFKDITGCSPGSYRKAL